MTRSRAVPTVILGAGLCGLSAAYHLEEGGDSGFLILERNPEAGGLTRTETYDGFSFDHSIHILYSRDAYIADLVCNKLLQGNTRKQARQSYCYTAGVYTEYPYQTNTYGLPPEVIAQNIQGLIEARAAAALNGPPPHFEAWIQRTFGRGIAEHFMIPYNRRQWAWDLTDMSYDWIADRIPMPEIRDVLVGALQPATQKHGLNREFWYPERGGIEALTAAFQRYIAPTQLWLDADVTAIDAERREVWLADGRGVRYERMISTIPLPALVRLLGDAVPREVRQHAAGLKYNVVHTVNVGLEGAGPSGDAPMHWVYFPEPSTIFHRLSFPGTFSPWMVPRGCRSIQAEISESDLCPCDRLTLIDRTLRDLAGLGMLSGQVRVAELVTLDPAYVIYDLKHRENTRAIRGYLGSLHIDSKGRFGEWEYLNMDHAILSGKAAAERIS